MTINNRYNIKEFVYLITDQDQFKRIITGIEITPNGELLYQVSCGTNMSRHYEFELSQDKDVIML